MKKNQKGFAHLESLLLLVIVIIIVGVGWYVWHAQSQANKSLADADNSANSIISSKKKKQSSSGSNSSSNTAKVAPIPTTLVSSAPTYVTTTPTIVNNYITINEWKVKAKYSGKITIMYAHDSNDKNHRSSFFSSKDLAAKNNACKAVFYPAGYIVRFKVDEHAYDSNGKDTGKSAKDYAIGLTNKDYKMVGDYYYFYRGPSAKCSELKEIQDLQTQTSDAVKAFLQSLEAVSS